MTENATAETPKKQTRYCYGRYGEYLCADNLRTAGFCVVRSSASKSPVDLVCLRKDLTLLCQVKRSRAVPSPHEWRSLADLDVAMGTVKIVVHFPPARGSRGNLRWADLSGWDESLVIRLLTETGWIDTRRGQPQFKLRGI